MVDLLWSAMATEKVIDVVVGVVYYLLILMVVVLALLMVKLVFFTYETNNKLAKFMRLWYNVKHV